MLLYLIIVQLFDGHEIMSCWKEMKLQQYACTLKNSYRSFSPSFLELKLFAESKKTKFSLPSEAPEDVTTPRNRKRG